MKTNNMKKILVIVAAVLLYSCGGNESQTGDPDEILSLTLVPDKTVLEADGKDAVRFTVLTDKNVDISDRAGVRVQNKTTGLYLDEMYYTAIENGTANFDVRYNGMRSEEITVTAQNRGKYEKYYRNVAVFQITGTWCVNCPNMTNALKIVQESFPGRVEVLAFHEGGMSGSDPYEIAATNEIRNIFGISGFPSAVVDMRALISSSSTTLLAEQILTSLHDYPATCGIKISSAFNSSTRSANFTISVASDKSTKYSVAYAILIDGLTATQMGADENYVHNNVVAGINKVAGVMAGEIAAGNEWTSPSGDFSATIPSSYDTDSVRVAVYVLTEVDGRWIINNVASCPVNNGSVDYKLNS